MITDILGFVGCGVIILMAGKRLSYYGDMLADVTGMGKAFIGLFLMSAVTSLPELMVGISSVSIVGDADLAVGDILGSCAFNLFILSVMEGFYRGKSPLLGSVSQSHIMAASLGIILLVLVGVGLIFQDEGFFIPFIGLNSVLFALIYFIALRIIYSYQKRHPAMSEENHVSPSMGKGQVIARYAGFATIIIIAALFLPHFAEGIADETGLGKSFIGTLLLAVSTSLPEISVSIAAVRAGSVDMAVGNVLGSNIFNVFILFIDDIFYVGDPILNDASDVHIMTVLSVVVMSAIAIIALVYRKEKKRFILDWDTSLILGVYICNMVLLYMHS